MFHKPFGSTRRVTVAAVLALAAGGAAARDGECNVRDYGARADGKLATAPIQRAIDDCARRGGGTVRLPPGRYVSGTLMLASRITLKLDAGAVLAGSKRVQDYRSGEDVGMGKDEGFDRAGDGDNAGLIVAHNVHDVSIQGPGRIEGSSRDFVTDQPHMPRDYEASSVRQPAAFEAAMHDTAYGPLAPVAGGRPGVLIHFFHVTDIEVRDITLADSPNWTMAFTYAQRGKVTGLTILNDELVPNSDGIDCNQCREMHFANGSIRGGDDGFAFFETEDSTVTGFSIASRSAAIRLESSRRMVFNALTFDTNRGIALFSSQRRSQGMDGILFSNIVMRTHLIPGHWWGKAEPIYVAVQPCTAKPCAGPLRNVTFSNIDATAEAGVVLAGAAGSEAEGLTLRDVRLRMVPPAPPLAQSVGGNFDRRWTAPSLKEAIVAADIPAIACSDLSGLTLRNVEVSWAAGLPAYTAHALACSRVSGLRIDGLSEQGVRPAGGQGIVLDASPNPRIERADWNGQPITPVTGSH